MKRALHVIERVPLRLALVAGVAALTTGCVKAVPRYWSENDVCPSRRVVTAGTAGAPGTPVTPGTPGAPGTAGAPGADAWITLLLQGYDAGTRRATRPAVDCTGAQVVWSAPAFSCSEGEAVGKELPAGPIAAGDVLSWPAGPGLWLVWIITSRYASGDALGPVALVSQVEVRGEKGEAEKRLRVRGLGALRAYPSKAKLRLQPMGAAEVLVAEGERCVAAGGCAWAVRLVPMRGERFVAEAVRGAKGECLEAALVSLKQQETVRVGEMTRRVEGEASVAFEATGIRVEESVLVQELGQKADAPPQLLHKAHDARLITVSGGRFTAESPSLWMRMEKDARER